MTPFNVCRVRRPRVKPPASCLVLNGPPPVNNPPVIRAFLFDIGNVLVRFDFNKAHRAIMALSDQEPDAEGLAQLEKAKLAYEDGQIPRAEFFRKVFDILQYRGT